MPDVQPNESEQEYVSRCVKVILEEGKTTDEKQALAICYEKFKESKKDNIVVGNILVKRDSAFGNCRFHSDKLESDFSDKKTKKNYITYPKRVITKVDVMNDHFKPIDAIKGAIYPEVIPIYSDHIVEEDYNTMEDYIKALGSRQIDGFVNNVQTIGNDDKTLIITELIK